MASTYTSNLGIEKIGTGEQSGTWGDTTNTNFDIIDQAVNGIVSVNLTTAGTSGSPNTLPIADGAVGASSNGRNAFIEFTDSSDLGATAYVQLTPNDAEKIAIIKNSLSGGRALIMFQGTYNASNDLEIPNGVEVVVKFDGNGSGAVVSNAYSKLATEGLLVDGAINATSSGVVLTTASLQGSIRDEVYEVTISSNAATLDPANGGIQYVTLTQNVTFSESFSSGDAIMLRLAASNLYTITWPTTTWVTSSGNVPPTMAGSDVVVFWKEGSTLYAAYVGSYV